jgi:UDP-N-acetylmuramoylalanine-D-glutamate ligase
MRVNPRIASIENFIAFDPGGRNVFGLMRADQLRLAAQSLLYARRVGIVTGLFIPSANAAETDGPPGAKMLGDVLRRRGVEVDYLTDQLNAPALRSLGLEPVVDTTEYLRQAKPTHLVSVERLGRCRDGRYRTMLGDDVTDFTAPLDDLFLAAEPFGVTTIGIGDGGNEIGMGKVFSEVLAAIPHGDEIACTVTTDFCIAAGTSNWGAYGLAGALSVLAGSDLLPSAEHAAQDLERLLAGGHAVDGRTRRRVVSVDGLPLAVSLRVLENIRRQTVASPFEHQERSVRVGVLGYGETGRAAVALLNMHGHRVRVSDRRGVNIDPGIQLDGLETGRHTLDFLAECEVVVASPGIPPDAEIRGLLYRRGIPVISELEMAFQLCHRPLIGITGTVGKRSTVELIERLFAAGRRNVAIGGNKGSPLSALLASGGSDSIALAVSSFQLESVTWFNPGVAAILNLHEDHLDRHGSMNEYARIKSRVFMNHARSVERTPTTSTCPSNMLIVSYDDARVRALARKHMGTTLFISSRSSMDRGAWIDGSEIALNLGYGQERYALGDSGSDGIPFPENLLTALIVARLYGIEPDAIGRLLQHEGRGHRHDTGTKSGQ